MVTHRFPPKVNKPRSFDYTGPFHPEKTDGNVDSEQAHALYLAFKERTKDNSQDPSNSKLTPKMNKTSKH